MNRIPVVVMLFGIVFSSVEPALSESDKQESADSRALDALVEKWIAAHDKGDAKALAQLYVDDGDFVGIDGKVVKGRAAIEGMYTQVFERLRGNKAKVIRSSRRWLSAKVVIDDGTWKVIGNLPKGAPSSGRYTTVFRKQGGKWRIVCARTMVPASQTALDD